MDKGISIYFSPEDLAELQEFVVWKTKKTAGNFVSIESSSDFQSLRDTADLIRQAKIDKTQILRHIEAQRGAQQELDQQREDVALIPGWEGERMQRQWANEAKQQAESYAAATNSGKRLRSAIGTDASITEGVLSWIKRQRARGHHPKTVS
jgi:hypothetical protein